MLWMEVEISQRCVECRLHWAGLRCMRLLYEFDIGDGQNSYWCKE